MLKKIIGTVTEQEKKEILALNERKNGLIELLLALDNGNLSEQLKQEINAKAAIDMENTTRLYVKWWEEKIHKYNWESHKDKHRLLDFKTNEVFIVNND